MQFLNDLDNLRSLVSVAQASAYASVESSQSVQHQCLTLSTELDLKNSSLKEHVARVNRLAEQLDHVHNDLQERDFSQKQLRDEKVRIEHDRMQAIVKGGVTKVLDEFCPVDLENIGKKLMVKDQEIVTLTDEIRIISAHWKLKAEDLEFQLEKHRRDDLELKKKVLKLEICLHEARAQTRKLQYTGERQDKVLKELKYELVTNQGEAADKEKIISGKPLVSKLRFQCQC